MSSLYIGKKGSIRVKSCNSQEEVELSVKSDNDHDYIDSKQAARLIDFLQIEFNLGDHNTDISELLPTPDQDNAILALQFCKDKLIRKLAKLQPTNNGQYYPDDIDQFVKVAKAIVGEMDK